MYYSTSWQSFRKFSFLSATVLTGQPDLKVVAEDQCWLNYSLAKIGRQIRAVGPEKQPKIKEVLLNYVKKAGYVISNKTI